MRSRSEFMPTFAELGIPFPLFEAPTTEASFYVGVASCTLCEAEGRHCFEVYNVSLSCPNCEAENWFVADGRHECAECGSSVPFPKAPEGRGGPLACYDCVRAGKTAMTKSTEFGAVSWEQA